MNAQQVATELGVTERTVRRWIQRGQLEAVKQGGHFHIDIEQARMVASPRAARQIEELTELRNLQARYDELERRYFDLLRILDPHAGGRSVVPGGLRELASSVNDPAKRASAWATQDDPNGAFGAPGMMGG